MSNVNASSAPSPLRNSPTPRQLLRDTDGEMWDSMALELNKAYGVGATLLSDEWTDAVLTIFSPQIFDLQLHVQCTVQIDAAASAQTVQALCAVTARGVVPSPGDFNIVALLTVPLSGLWVFPLGGVADLPPQYPGAYDYTFRVLNGPNPPDVIVTNMLMKARKGRIPARST